jgi:cysteine desulfurase
MKSVYLDYASQTPVDKRVEREMARYVKAERKGLYANPSAVHGAGVAAKKILEVSRASVAKFLDAHSDEIVFTSGGTEANGLAIEGSARAMRRSGFAGSTAKPHIIISAIEHASIMEMATMMEKHGCDVTRLPVDRSGMVMLDELKKAIRPSTFMVSIMTVNNEIGVIEPLSEIAKIIRHARTNITKHPSYPLFHTDASQAALYYELDVEKLGVDLLTLDSIKVYGPKGVGALYVKRGTPIEEIMYGGGQENGLRSGTENVAGAVGFSKALEIAALERITETMRLVALRDYFIDQLRTKTKEHPKTKVSGSSSDSFRINGAYTAGDARTRIANNINVSLPGVDHEFFMLQLDARGVACSTKSACLRDEDESYVLKAIGEKGQSLRFSLGRFTKKKDIVRALKFIDEILAL